jgi:hypothetical protein
MQLPLADPVVLVIFWCLNYFIASLGTEPLPIPSIGPVICFDVLNFAF